MKILAFALVNIILMVSPIFAGEPYDYCNAIIDSLEISFIAGNRVKSVTDDSVLLIFIMVMV